MSYQVITIIGVLFIFLMTTLGAGVVLFFKKQISKKINSLFMGFSSGVMIAASVWSLIIPSINQSNYLGNFSFVPAAISIVLGAVFLIGFDKFVVNTVNKNSNQFLHFYNRNQGLDKCNKLFLAVTLHNIPEGLAVGLAFGNAMLLNEISAFYSALWLAIGIGIQNFPEGAAISLPFKEKTKSNTKSFFIGSLSGAVEPVMAVIGIVLSKSLSVFMPWLLSLSAGAMIFVVVQELLPDSKINEKSTIGSWGFVIGFILMMILDVTLG